MSDEVLAVVRGARLRPSGLRLGYDASEVDQLLGRVAEAAAAGRPLRDLAEGARFAARRGPDCYDMGDVDNVLEAVLAACGEVESDKHRALRWIEELRFTRTGLGRVGYPMHEVDSFLDELAELVRDDCPIAAAVQAVHFTSARRVEGYSIEEVEGFLVALVDFHEGVRVDRSRPGG